MSKRRRKIVVRLCNWIGDAVMNIPALEAVRRSNPDAEITVIARSWVEDVVSFRPDLVDRCLSFDDRVGALGLIQFIRRLREERFDIAFTFLNHIKGSIILALAGIPIRVGFRKLETRFFLTNHLDRKSMPKDRHQYEDYLDLVEGAGFSIEPRPGPRLDPDFELRKKLAAELLTGLPQPMLAIQAGAAFGTAKRWLPERYALTARQFIE
ncbi:MAG: glycosyltransferase family 9 protein, partial [Acidobacteriota bacterium]|nr:glycosyltransferase family 9 protein [Acidobacteriota bacterium]